MRILPVFGVIAGIALTDNKTAAFTYWHLGETNAWTGATAKPFQFA